MSILSGAHAAGPIACADPHSGGTWSPSAGGSARECPHGYRVRNPVPTEYPDPDVAGLREDCRRDPALRQLNPRRPHRCIAVMNSDARLWIVTSSRRGIRRGEVRDPNNC
jgi:hypothetical protein